MVHLITTLGYIEDQAAIPAIMDIINTQPQDANIRQAAYEAMERIPSPRTAICLVQGPRILKNPFAWECGPGPLTKTCPNHWWPD